MTRGLVGFTAQLWRQEDWGPIPGSSLVVKLGQVTQFFWAALCALHVYTGVIMKCQ